MVDQMDLVPTLSILLGLPIPFNNLGLIVNDFLPNIIDNQTNLT